MSTLTEFVRPDAIFPPGSMDAPVVDGPLDPCPACGSYSHEAPEGIHDVHSARVHGAAVGDSKWNFEHCWKCGFRPGHNTAVPQHELARQFAAFKSWMQDQLPTAGERGIGAPDAAEVGDLKAQLAAAQEREEALRVQLGGNGGSKSS